MEIILSFIFYYFVPILLILLCIVALATLGNIFKNLKIYTLKESIKRGVNETIDIFRKDK